jgi:hypothetical protein
MALLPALVGALLILLGAGLTAGGLGVLAAARRARLLTGILAAVATGLAALGAVLAMIVSPPDPVLAIALTVATLVFGVSALLFLRPRR